MTDQAEPKEPRSIRRLTLADGLIISAWFVLAVSGRWRPEPSWIDRSGRVLAIAWIVRYLIHLVSGAVV
jgi:hypothetical protein